MDSQSAKMDSQSDKITDMAVQLNDLCEANGILEDRLVRCEVANAELNSKVVDLEKTVESLKKQNIMVNQQLLKDENY